MVAYVQVRIRALNITDIFFPALAGYRVGLVCICMHT